MAFSLQMATPPLPQRPTQSGRTVRGPRETRSTGVQAGSPPPAEVHSVPAKSALAAPALLALPSRYTNLCTAPSSSAGVNGLITYPSAPCCFAQNLSLSVFFELTITTGILRNAS